LIVPGRTVSGAVDVVAYPTLLFLDFLAARFLVRGIGCEGFLDQPSPKLGVALP
jgi:hypothetical protein